MVAEGRAELLADLARGMTRAAESVPGAWDGFSVVAEITALGVRVTGFRYLTGTAAMPMLMDSDVIDAIAALRSASPGPQGELFDVYVARLDRARGGVVDQAFSSGTGAGYRVTAANVSRIAELVQPGSPFLPPTPTTSTPLPLPLPLPLPPSRTSRRRYSLSPRSLRRYSLSPRSRRRPNRRSRCPSSRRRKRHSPSPPSRSSRSPSPSRRRRSSHSRNQSSPRPSSPNPRNPNPNPSKPRRPPRKPRPRTYPTTLPARRRSTR